VKHYIIWVYREKQEHAAKMIRDCQSHLRFGHFEYFYHSKQPKKLQSLFDYCFKYHFTECAQAESPYLAVLQKIVYDTAQLVAKWQALGFNHGVMNTDNMSIHGITFDYGPYAFLDDFEPTFIYNHSDTQGRYSFDSQPGIGLWNLNALAQTFTPHLEIEQIEEALSNYEPTLLKEYSILMHNKLDLLPGALQVEVNSHIVNTWLDILAVEKRTILQRIDSCVSSISSAIIKACVTNLLIEKDLMYGLTLRLSFNGAKYEPKTKTNADAPTQPTYCVA
jgi:uncharacterized protein YdiU (UPF0061 family)